jgi:hypothetical protein
VHEMVDPQLMKLRQEKLLHEAETNRPARALRAGRKRRADTNRVSALAWEVKRIAGRLHKLLRALKDAQ